MHGQAESLVLEILRSTGRFTSARLPPAAHAKDRLARIAAREAEIVQDEKRLPKSTLGSRLVAELSSDDIKRWKWGLVPSADGDPEAERQSKDTANRVLTSFKPTLNMAWRNAKNHIPSDAEWRKVKPFKDVGRAREVHLDVEQSRRLVNVCSGGFRLLVTAALITGALAPHELAVRRVRDFDGRSHTLTIADGKTGRRVVTLSDEATEFFEEMTAERAPNEMIFLKDDGTPWGKNHHVRPMRDAVKRAKLPEDYTSYALRHTHASQAILADANLKMLADNMGTSIRMLELHYAKFIAEARRKHVEERGFKLGLKPGKVASIRGRRPT